MSLSSFPEARATADRSEERARPRPTVADNGPDRGAPLRVMIAMSDTGGGHRAMSSALAGALERRYGPSVQVFIEDVFAISPRTIPERVTRLYGPLIRVAPWLYGWMYHSLDTKRRYDVFSGLTKGRTQDKMQRLLDRIRPDVIVSTHPLANRPLLDAIQVDGASVPVLASVSELVTVHVSWVEPRLSLLNTATTESYQSVLRWGARPEIVRCVGLPVDERFGHVEPSPAELREAMGLAPDRFTVLLIGGGEGAGGIEAIVRRIQKTDLSVQLVVVCGRNDALRKRLNKSRLRTPTFVLGFVRTIPELMHAADVVVTKGGPQTIGEALVSGRPVILTQTLPGQEEGNGAFVESRGVGFRPGSVRRIVDNLASLVNDPEQRAWMTANARRHGRPDAAGKLAELVVEVAGSQ